MDNFNFIESEIERDPALKAALLADSILKMLPSETALAVQYCVILHWFDQDILKAFLQNFAPLLSTPSSALSEIYEQIADLPFIETLRGGVAFNNLTREGLLKRYALLQSALLINAAKIMAPIYEAREAYGSIAAEAFFCYIISNNTESAMKLLDRLLEEAVCREDWQYVTGVLQLCNEAEQLPFVHPFTLSERQWIILGLAYQAQGEIDSAIDGFHKALEANPRNIRVRMTLAAIYVGQRSYREALQEYDTIIQLDGTYVEAYFNQGIVYLQQHQYEEAIKKFRRAIHLDSTNAEVYRYYIHALVSLSQAADLSNNPLENQAFCELYVEAEPLLQQALAIQEKSLDALHLEIAKILKILANFYHNRGQDKDAVRLWQQAQAIDEKKPNQEQLESTASSTGSVHIGRTPGKYSRIEPIIAGSLAMLVQPESLISADEATSEIFTSTDEATIVEAVRKAQSEIFTSTDEATIVEAVRKAQEGDETSFTQLYHLYYTEIYKHLLRLVGIQEDAADLAAVTFTRAWRRLPGIHDGRHFRGWLYKIATNVAIDHLRNKKKKFFLWGNVDEAPTNEHAERFEESIEVEELTWLALNQVAPKPRASLVLHLEGFSNEEIAMFLGFKEKSVGTYLSTARKQFLRAYHRLKTM